MWAMHRRGLVCLPNCIGLRITSAYIGTWRICRSQCRLCRCHFSVIVNFWGSSLYVMCHVQWVSDGKSCSGQLKIKRTHCKYKYKYSIKCIHRNLHNPKPACQPLPLVQLFTKSIIWHTLSLRAGVIWTLESLNLWRRKNSAAASAAAYHCNVHWAAEYALLSPLSHYTSPLLSCP